MARIIKEKDTFLLRLTKIKVRPGHDAGVDEANEKTGKDVIVKEKNQPTTKISRVLKMVLRPIIK
jgi:hypothetical protein